MDIPFLRERHLLLPRPLRREIMKALVQRIQVHTTPSVGLKRPRASVTVQYCFSKDITYTIRIARTN